jgi:hypothetical protein
MFAKIRKGLQPRKTATRHLASTVAFAAFVLANPLSAYPTHADTMHIGESGYWTAFGGTSDKGTPVCGISTLGSQRALLIKWFKGEDKLTAQIFKDTWHMREGANVPIRMQLGGYSPWAATALGRGEELEFAIPVRNVAQFEREVRSSSKLRISFSGSESDWEGQLAGAGEMMSLMVRCMQVLGEDTQPVY